MSLTSTILYDRYIHLKLYYLKQVNLNRNKYTPQEDSSKYDVFEIKFPTQHDAGMKPRIDISFERTQDNFCYSAILTIYNLRIPYNSIYVDKIDVEAGYTQSDASHFTFIPFSSYTPMPGPDGYTVFECIIGTAKPQLWSAKPYIFSVNSKPKPPTIGDVLDYVQDQLGGDMRVLFNQSISIAIEDNLREQPFTKVDIPPETYSTGYSFLMGIRDHLEKALSEGEYHVSVLVFNNFVEFICLKNGSVEVWSTDAVQTNLKSSRLVYNLQRVNSVDWNAGTLNVTAPWVPSLVPGELFKINPRYYKASRLPNDVARQQIQKDTFDLYWIINMKVVFSTTEEGQNQMSLLAVPMKNSPAANQMSSYDTGEIKIQDAEDIIKTEFKRLYGEPQTIAYGGTLEVKNRLPGQLPLSWGQWTAYTIQPKDTLSTICDKLNLPLAYERANDKVVLPASKILYPFILAQTATVYTNKSQPDWKLFDASANNPELIITGHKLLLPSSGFSWATIAGELRAGVEPSMRAFTTCISTYKTLGLTSWASVLERGYNALRDTTVKIYG